MRGKSWHAAGLLALSAAPALSAETQAYTYDSTGRLVRVQASNPATGTVSYTSGYTWDAAGNRLCAATVAGSAALPGCSAVAPSVAKTGTGTTWKATVVRH